MPLAPVDLFAGVEAALASLVGDFHRLTIKDAGGGIAFLARVQSQRQDQHLMDGLPDSLLPPPAKVAVDRGSRGEVVRQHPPWTIDTNHINNGIHNKTTLVNRRATERVKSGHQFSDQVPLFVRQTTGITWDGLHPTLRPNSGSIRKEKTSSALLSTHALSYLLPKSTTANDAENRCRARWRLGSIEISCGVNTP